MMEDLAWVYRWPPSELYAMTPTQIVRWHAAARRIQRQTARGGGE